MADRHRPASPLKAIASIALLLCAPAVVSAAPVSYTFTTSAGAHGNADAPSAAVIAALGPSAVVSGTFIYDASSPATGTGSGGVTIYGNAAGTTASFASLVGSVNGISFSDPRGFVIVGNNTSFSSLTNVDLVEACPGTL